MKKTNSTKLGILISVPNKGWIHKHCTFALLKLQQDRRYNLTFILPTHTPFENNLHHIVRDFILGGYDYWLSFDADNPPTNNPLDLISLEKDIIGCPTPVWHYTGKKPGERPIYWNAYKFVPEEDAYTEWPDKQGLQKVDAIGTGCFLVHKRVFMDQEMQKGCFTRSLYPDGRVEKGNDIRFCEKARERGFEVWAHFDYPCMHFHELELTEVIRAFQNVNDG